MSAIPTTPTYVRLADSFHSQIVFYATPFADTFMMECITSTEETAVEKDVHAMTEEEFEAFVPKKDEDAGIMEHSGILRVRHIDRSIGDSLKKLYHHRCQMTGERVGEPYGVACIEAHHIVPFTESLNNDTSNIIILSPNYHRIIHKAHPIFNRSKLQFEFSNGLIEKVKLDYHLRAK